MRTNRFRIFVNLLLTGVVLAAPVVSLCSTAEAAPKSPAKRGGKAQTARPKAAAPLRLKWHAFPDVTMGAPAAYSVMLPVNWSAKGKVEWQPVGEVPFPQQVIEITSPLQGRISFEPQITFSYMEGTGITSQGVPAPANFPQWLVQVIPQSNPKVSNVKLVSSRRDAKGEEFLQKMHSASGGGGGMEREIHVIVLDYNEGNQRRREEMNVTYARFAPYLSQNMNSQLWSITPGVSISAPAHLFAAHRAALFNAAYSVTRNPSWHIQSQAVIAEMSRQRIANKWEAIKQRGRQISQMSDAEYAKYKKDSAISDGAQRTRINSINETDDFRDTNGNIVNLPMHYNHVFSDGKGNYVLSNNSQDRPGQLWKTIRPMK